MRYRLGGSESSSPSNDPTFPSDYSLRYPDCINSQYELLTKHFGLKTLDVVLGFSMVCSISLLGWQIARQPSPSDIHVFRAIWRAQGIY
jgi:homoserine acetyltransferase